MRQPGPEIVDADAAAPPRVADDAFCWVRTVPEERRRHPEIAALVLRGEARCIKLVEPVSAALVFEQHGVSEIVDDARTAAASCLADGRQPGRLGDPVK